MGVNTTPLDMRDRGYFQTPDSTADRPKADNGFYVTFCDGVEVLKAIRERLVDARRQAALDFENDTTEAAYVFYQRHIDAADRAIADSFKPASKTLNEGRGLFPSDEQFGKWVAHCQLDSADWKAEFVLYQVGKAPKWVDDSGLSQLATKEISRGAERGARVVSVRRAIWAVG